MQKERKFLQVGKSTNRRNNHKTQTKTTYFLHTEEILVSLKGIIKNTVSFELEKLQKS